MRIGIISLFVLSLCLASLGMPARAQTPSWATRDKYIQYTTSYSYTVQGLSYPAQSFNYNTTLRVISSSGNSVMVSITTNAPYSGSNAQIQTLFLDKPFPSTSGQFGLAFPLYCPPGNLTSCTSQVGLGWQGSGSGISGFYNPTSSSAPQSTVSSDNTPTTTVGTVKTSKLTVSEDFSFSPVQAYNVNFHGSESASYDSTLGLLAAGSSHVSETYQVSSSYGSSSGTINLDTSTKMTKTNIDSWTAGTANPGTPSIPWFLLGIIAAAAVAVLVAVIAMARRRRPSLAPAVGSTAPMGTGTSTIPQAGPVFCGHCGAQMDQGSAFCGKCGASMT